MSNVLNRFSTPKTSLIPVGQMEFIKDVIEPFAEKKAIVFVEKHVSFQRSGIVRV